SAGCSSARSSHTLTSVQRSASVISGPDQSVDRSCPADVFARLATGLTVFERTKQPCPCGRPLAFDAAGRETQHRGGLLDGQTAEITKLHDATLCRIQGFKLLQRLVQGQRIDSFETDDRSRDLDRV